jgi:hypothetical protein
MEQSGRDRSPLSGVQVKYAWSYTSTPPHTSSCSSTQNGGYTCFLSCSHLCLNNHTSQYSGWTRKATANMHLIRKNHALINYRISLTHRGPVAPDVNADKTVINYVGRYVESVPTVRHPCSTLYQSTGYCYKVRLSHTFVPHKRNCA